MKIALAQVNPTVGAFAENVARFSGLASEAMGLGCDLIIFPELAVCGYPPKDLLDHGQFIRDGQKAIDALVSRVRGIGVICGCPLPREGAGGRPLYNAAVFFEDGRVIAEVKKRLLPFYDVFDETRYFEPGPASTPVSFRGRSIGLTICEDVWNDPDFARSGRYLDDPVADLARQGVDLFVNVAASPFELGKPAFREGMFRHLARKYGRPFLFANLAGGQDSLIFDGSSLAVGSDGALMARAACFEEDLVTVDLDASTGETRAWPLTDEAMLAGALEKSLSDYMRRCGFTKAVLGLSGGVDSAVTAALAARAVGKENVLGVLMPSPFTSRESVSDATELAKNLGIGLETIPINGVFDAYLATLGPVFEGRRPDTTEENLQARIRGNLLMAISNKYGHLVLSTGNKSELAVGYCTLYGDLSGGFALISDLPKTVVYRLARHLNAEGAGIPERILTRPPSAELRPDQKDEDDLPPYDELDAILELIVARNASFDEIVARGFTPGIVSRVISMVRRSEYKRLQAPIGPKVTSKAFGYGRRYPLSHSWMG